METFVLADEEVVYYGMGACLGVVAICPFKNECTQVEVVCMFVSASFV